MFSTEPLEGINVCTYMYTYGKILKGILKIFNLFFCNFLIIFMVSHITIH